MKKSALPSLLLLIAASCATPGQLAPTETQLREAGQANLYGPPPTNTKARIEAYLRAALFDPYSMRDLRIGEPEQAYYYRSGGWLRNEYVWWGWRCSVTYNAKNRFGAYTGLHTEHYYFYNDEMLDLAGVAREPDQAAPAR